MLIQNKKFKLKDGRYAILRSPREDDAPALLDYLITTAGETDFLIRYPEECRLSEEQEREWIRDARESKDMCTLVCEVDGRLAGNCEVRFNKRLKTRHRGTIGIALRKEYWSLGIGTAMFEELIRIAQNGTASFNWSWNSWRVTNGRRHCMRRWVSASSVLSQTPSV